jgi:hypothetical protein
MGECVWVHWLAMPASSPLALRFLLAGSSARYPSYNLPLYGNQEILRDGVPGVLSLQPMYLMTDWRLYATLSAVTKN